MTLRTLLALGAILFALSTLSVQAEDERRPGDGSSLTLYFENDLFAATDRYYTNGMRLSWLSRDLQTIEGNNEWAEVLRPILDFLTKEDPDYTHNVGIALGQGMYTPQDVFNRDLVPNDRPYAGWTYLALSLHRKNDRQLHVVELSLGMIGDYSFAHETQDAVHDIRNIRKSEGWDHQLDNEPGLILTYDHRRRYATSLSDIGVDRWTDNKLGIDAIPYFSLSVGNVLTQATVGTTVRVGWNLPKNFHSNRIRTAGYALGASASAADKDQAHPGKLSVYLFTGLEGKAVARDITLDGNTFAPSHSVDKENFVGEFEAGLGVRYDRFSFTYTYVVRTKEFTTQPENQEYVALSFGYAF